MYVEEFPIDGLEDVFPRDRMLLSAVVLYLLLHTSPWAGISFAGHRITQAATAGTWILRLNTVVYFETTLLLLCCCLVSFRCYTPGSTSAGLYSYEGSDKAEVGLGERPFDNYFYDNWVADTDKGVYLKASDSISITGEKGH